LPIRIRNASSSTRNEQHNKSQKKNGARFCMLKCTASEGLMQW
jgi:hypothetical protein